MRPLLTWYLLVALLKGSEYATATSGTDPSAYSNNGAHGGYEPSFCRYVGA
jgi:hypothetical protein